MKNTIKKYLTGFITFLILCSTFNVAHVLADYSIKRPSFVGSGDAAQSIDKAGADIMDIFAVIFGVVAVIMVGILAFRVMTGKTDDFFDRTGQILGGVLIFASGATFVFAIL